MTESAHNPGCLWIARALQHFDMHCLLFNYSGNVMKNHNKTRKTHHIWPLLNNLIKLAWYTNMNEQLLIRAELLLPYLRIGNSSEALLTIRCLHLQQSLSLRPYPNVKLLVSSCILLVSTLTCVALLVLHIVMFSVFLMSLYNYPRFFLTDCFIYTNIFLPMYTHLFIMIPSGYTCKSLAF